LGPKRALPIQEDVRTDAIVPHLRQQLRPAIRRRIPRRVPYELAPSGQRRSWCDQTKSWY